MRIYAPYVRDTAVSFELEPPDEDTMRRRIVAALAEHDWVVLGDTGDVVGYAYSAPYRARAAYRWSCEVSVYVDGSRRRQGAGRALYGALLERLAARGYRTAIAGMTLPNAASAALHRAAGFEPVGVFRSVGFKFGRWHDVGYVQRRLGDDGADHSPPAPITPA